MFFIARLEWKILHFKYLGSAIILQKNKIEMYITHDCVTYIELSNSIGMWIFNYSQNVYDVTFQNLVEHHTIEIFCHTLHKYWRFRIHFNYMSCKQCQERLLWIVMFAIMEVGIRKDKNFSVPVEEKNLDWSIDFKWLGFGSGKKIPQPPLWALPS